VAYPEAQGVEMIIQCTLGKLQFVHATLLNPPK